MRHQTWRYQSLYLLVIASCSLLLLSCKKEPTSPIDERPFIASQDFRKLILTLSGYDTVHVTHRFGINLRSVAVIKIGIGTKGLTGYEEFATASGIYDETFRGYAIHFDFSLALDSSHIESPLTVRYYLNNLSVSDVDTIVLLYAYPYSTTTELLTASDLDTLHGPSAFQDVDRLGPIIFFHPLGPWGLFAFDERTRDLRELLSYPGGDHIAADSIFVFWDSHTRISRFNLVTNSVDLQFSHEFSPPPSQMVAGMDVYRNRLFVFSRDSTLRVFDFEGMLLDSMRCNSDSYYATIHDSIMYGIRYRTAGANTITRFDLRTRQFLPEMLSPARKSDGIKASGGVLYYCDYNKRMVGAVPISDLRIAQ